LKTRLVKVRKDVVVAREEIGMRIEEERAVAAKREAQSSKDAASRLQFEFSPMVKPLSRVMN
jgi:hypothetical protein